MQFQQGIVSSLVLLAALSIGGCRDDGEAAVEGGTPARFAGEYPMRVVTTCGMVTDLVRAVAGEQAIVTGLMGPTVDPHTYKATRNDVQALMEADVVFYAGLHLEGRMADTFARFGRSGKPVYPVTEGLDEARLREPPEFQGHYDPHVWMDVAIWSDCAVFVAESLAEFDPPHAEHYRRNAAEYRARLEKLDAYVKEVIASIPKKQRVLVTAHDAFGYFGRAYGIEVNAVQGISTEAQAGLADVNALVDFIVRRKIPAIFVESSVSPKNIEHVEEACRDRGWNVRRGGELFSDAMGPVGTYEGTYIGMIDHNATTVTRALGGKSPARGMNGKLAAE